MAKDTVTQIDHPAPIRPASAHPQNIRASREKKKKKEKKDGQPYEHRDRVTINGSSETSEEKKSKTSAMDAASAKQSKIDIRI